MSINGGGIHGVILLKFLNQLQNILSSEYPIQDLINVTFSISTNNTFFSREYILLTNYK